MKKDIFETEGEFETLNITEEAGYRDIDWDQLDPAEVEVHDEIMKGEIREIDPAKLSDLGRWALAQYYADQEDLKRFLQLAQQLMKGEKKHPALDYGEIALEIAEELVHSKKSKEVQMWCNRAKRLGGDPDSVELVLATNELINGKKNQGLKRIQRLIDATEENIDILIRISIAFLEANDPENALLIIDQIEFIAESENDRELKEIVASLRDVCL